MNFKQRYEDLEVEVLTELREMVNNSPTKSKNVDTKAITINIGNYTELAILHDKLIFMDDNGYQYNIFNVSLEILIDIIENNK